MQIVAFKPEYKQDFVRLNLNWIQKYFTVEQHDRDILDNVEQLVSNGAQIFFAVSGGKVLATCMIEPLGNDEWEVCKFASDENCSGKGAGTAVFRACLRFAKDSGAKKITIISNSILKAALHIYQREGFKQVPLDGDGGYARADVKMEMIL